MPNDNNIKVLIADDQHHCRVLMRSIVLPLNYTVVGEAENGEKALEMYIRENPDLLLLDIEMPLKSGPEVLEEIQKMKSKTCIIMMTSVADSEVVRKCLKLGAYNYILKSTSIRETRQRIKETYEKYQFFKLGNCD
ncbi:response regulator transcription factor [Candidatus Latescibacterota bacterium]